MMGRVKSIILGMDPAERAEMFARFGFSPAELKRWGGAFSTSARAERRAPKGDWSAWLIMAGRGFGKTRAGAEWVRREALWLRGRTIALIGATHHDVRSVMVEGPSGLLNIGPPELRPIYEPSHRRLRWERTKTTALLFSAEEPDSLRGPEFHLAWGDEIARWPHGLATWANLKMALRRGRRPRAVLTTTPKPVELVRRLLADAATGHGVVVTRGRTTDNAAYLAPGFVDAMLAEYGGTRLGRQELDGELIEDIEGALWTREMIEDCRVRDPSPRSSGGGEELPPHQGEGFYRRIVVGVDPPASAGEGADACGIVVVGLGDDGRGYVLADRSVRSREPNGWAAAVVTTARAFEADRVVAEANNGGDMVAGVLTAIDAALPVKLVRASWGKSARAEPVAALYSRGRVSHAGRFPELEDELCGLATGGGYFGPGRSPDRADALVWALTELMLGPPPAPMPCVIHW